jgi:hypothetical protein
MHRSLIDRMANIVLYEGYMLYPYRPSVKSRQRWTFGGLYPEGYCRHTAGSDSHFCQTECLVMGNAGTTIEVIARFLHLITRQALGSLQAWQEAEEREVAVEGMTLGELERHPTNRSFSFPGRQWQESVDERLMSREQKAIHGEVEISTECLRDGLFRLRVVVRNVADFDGSLRDDALMQTLVSTHVLLGVQQGEFVSLLDPPEGCRAAAEGCRQQGLFPVQVGESGQSDTMLASPIILYDYPQIAPESPGDLFDGTEIDEILSLRILTLTDEEKRLGAALDERTRLLLERTENLAAEQLLGLHGVLRPAAEASAP